MVRVVRLERTVSWSQTRRDTNFAIPGYSLFCHDTTASGKNKVFSVCGHSCGQSRFYATFSNRVKSSKRRRHKALRHFAMPRPGYRHGTPKPRALPSELHPVMKNVLGSKQSVLPAKPEISIAEAPQKSKTGGSALFAFGVKAVAIFPRSCYNDREVAFLHEGGVSNG